MHIIILYIYFILDIELICPYIGIWVLINYIII